MERQRVPKLASSLQHQPSLNRNAGHPLLHLKQTIGNQAIQGILRSENMHVDPGIQAFVESRFGHDVSQMAIHPAQTAMPQAKLSVNQPGDIYEQEADQVAEKVMRITDPKSPVPDDRAAIGSMDVPVAADTAFAGDRGRPLDETARAFMEPRFGHDFSQVRVHTDTRASALARSVHALAFTVGQDVVFRGQQYAPGTSAGRRLLAHELAHVVQQSRQSQGAVHPSIMRAVDSPPSSQTLQQEIAALQLRLALLRKQNPDVTTPEIGAVEELLATKQSLVQETDPTRQRILFYRAQIRELRRQLRTTRPASSPERERLRQSVFEYESALAGALSANIQRLNKDIAEYREKLALSPSYIWPLHAAEAELMQNESEHKTISMIFDPQAAATISKTYATKVTPEMAEACMGCFYSTLGALYTPEEAASIQQETKAGSKAYDIAHKVPPEKRGGTYHVDRIMDVVRAHGKAGPAMTFKYRERAKGWSPNVEGTLLGLARSDYPGIYAFGMSLHGGYHSVHLVIDTLQEPSQIYWMDQFAKGFSSQYEKDAYTDKNNVTGKLEEKMSLIRPGYGFADTKIWQLIPTSATPASGVGGPPPTK
jgi:hypothetical protein